MRFHIASAARHTGALLQQLVEEELREEGIRKDAVVCYGVGEYSGTLPVLNSNCSRYNKMRQGQLLHEALGTNALPIHSIDSLNRGGAMPGAVLGRSLSHTKGRDIKLILEPWQLPLVRADFFTPYIPSSHEYRTWVYRNRHLGTYEKVLTRPQDYKRIGRNHDNGFDFSYREEVPDALKDVCRRAIAALGLDFGAVDTLQATSDGRYVVLEVNSAPGVQNERRRVIQALAHRIVRWAANDCPNRRANGAA